MTQRSYSNDRYRKDAKLGSTRKSAAKAKPVRKQGSVEVSSSSAKSKPKHKPGEVEKDWSGLPTSPEIKKWRRVWWVLLLGGLGMIGVSYAVPELRANEAALRIVSILVLAFSMAAIMIDLVIIRRLRKELIAKSAKKPAKASKPEKGSEDAS